MSLLAALTVCWMASQDPSPAAAEAKKELDAARASIEELLDLRRRHQMLQGRMRQPSQPEELKKIAEEMQAIVTAFEEKRGEIVKTLEGLVASTTAELEKAPEDAGLIEARADALTLSGREGEAVEDFRKLAALRPEDLDLQVRVGRLLHRNNRFDGALETMGKVLEKEPGNLEASAVTGLCQFALQRFDAAKATFDALLEREGLDAGQRDSFEKQRDFAVECAGLWKAETEIRAREKEADDLPRVKLTTSRGEVTIELYENEAPNTVANFVELVTKKFYDGLSFHRVIPNFMAQGGCPKGDGTGDAGYRFEDELEEGRRNHFRGSLSMANSGPDTNGSQFFITHLPTTWLNGRHTVFGRVIEGQEVVDALAVGDTIVTAEVLRKREHEYAVKKLGD